MISKFLFGIILILVFVGVPILVVSWWFKLTDKMETKWSSKTKGIIIILSFVLGYILLIGWIIFLDEYFPIKFLKNLFHLLHLD